MIEPLVAMVKSFSQYPDPKVVEDFGCVYVCMVGSCAETGKEAFVGAQQERRKWQTCSAPNQIWFPQLGLWCLWQNISARDCGFGKMCAS
mmetsp:Transcript_69801/g.137243  ORF Transcript_69801/g.137243 Transcript_69801/m.137243 type:complete len:90 (-) Transcript_69801:202-471(-)